VIAARKIRAILHERSIIYTIGYSDRNLWLISEVCFISIELDVLPRTIVWDTLFLAEVSCQWERTSGSARQYWHYLYLPENSRDWNSVSRAIAARGRKSFAYNDITIDIISEWKSFDNRVCGALSGVFNASRSFYIYIYTHIYQIVRAHEHAKKIREIYVSRVLRPQLWADEQNSRYEWILYGFTHARSAKQYVMNRSARACHANVDRKLNVYSHIYGIDKKKESGKS